MIQARQASKLLPHGVADTRKAFIDINLDLHHGERLALFSANAYEARTLLDCLAGIDKPDQGEVMHHGSVSWPVGSNQGFHKKLSGYSNARFCAEVYSKPGCIDEDIGLIQELIGADNPTFHEPISSWKPPMRKLMELAIPLVFEFDVTLVGKINYWNHRASHPASLRLRKLFEQRIDGRSLIVAAPGQHNLAMDYCDQGIVIIDGKYAYRGDTEVCLELIEEHSQFKRAQRRQAADEIINRLLQGSDESDESQLDDFNEEVVDESVRKLLFRREISLD